LRNAQKRHKKIKKKKYIPTSFTGYLPDIRRFHFFPSAPLVLEREAKGGRKKNENESSSASCVSSPKKILRCVVILLTYFLSFNCFWERFLSRGVKKHNKNPISQILLLNKKSKKYVRTVFWRCFFLLPLDSSNRAKRTRFGAPGLSLPPSALGS
jgi:hypothetical protein